MKKHVNRILLVVVFCGSAMLTIAERSEVRNPEQSITATEEKTTVEITGTVKETSRSLPIAGAAVRFVSSGEEVEATTDAEGKYRITLTETTKEYAVQVSHKGYVTVTEAAKVYGASGEKDFEMSFNTEESTVQIKVVASTGVALKGLKVNMSNTKYGLDYGEATINANGECRFSEVVNGYNNLVIDATSLGLEKYVNENFVVAGDTEATIELKEPTRTPYSLKTTLNHDNKTGANDVVLTWNNSDDYFYDDFESYEDFSIDFAPWTGIDGDKAATAQIQGVYPNSQLPQYATIFNPLTITPPVWYDYPVLRPYSGKQYVGFIRTASGEPNNDWLISPKIKIGVDNVVSFMAKAGDATKERFRVGISTSGTNQKDFVFLTQGNYETVDYKAWKKITYDLAAYEGKEAYIVIQCVSNSAFMLMVDDFYVGPAQNDISQIKSRRAQCRQSANNVNERFKVFIDGEEVGTTTETSYTFRNIASGTHKLAVQAVYTSATSEVSETAVEVPNSDAYGSVAIKVTTNNKKSADGFMVSYVNESTGEQLSDAVEGGKSSFASLAKGDYLVNIEHNGYETYSKKITVEGNNEYEATLKELLTSPFNLVVNEEGTEKESKYVFKWNQDLGFTDSFEEYPDFTQKIGDWITVDGDQMPTYGISFNGTNITIPGFEQNGKLGAMVFNPLNTTPSLAADVAMLAPDGDKEIMFMSAQQGQSDDWLLSPVQRINKGYVLRFTAKTYQASYPETIEVGIMTDRSNLSTFVMLDKIVIPSTEWTIYELDLSAYENQDIAVVFHYVSKDMFIAHLDNVYVGPKEENATLSNPNVIAYNVYLDGDFKGTTTDSYYDFGEVEAGTHTAGVEAVYTTGKSEKKSIEFNAASGVESVISRGVEVVSSNGRIQVKAAQESHIHLYSVSGLELGAVVGEEANFQVSAGVYVVAVNCAKSSVVKKVVVSKH